jgi:hypothetical protein
MIILMLAFMVQGMMNEAPASADRSFTHRCADGIGLLLLQLARTSGILLVARDHAS